MRWPLLPAHLLRGTCCDACCPLGAQEEYKKIDLTLVCADGSRVDIPGMAGALLSFLAANLAFLAANLAAVFDFMR